ncbi:MAG TPA: hypothetical protein VFF73_10125 [Planctomycetota bacterium]|nr:hypothetical protein [Planctomycetota bacterium]
MSPEANVKEEKLTVTMAPPPAALAADKKKAGAKKRTEAENLIDGHAGEIKTDRASEDEKARELARQGRNGGLLGFVIFGIMAFAQITKYGRFLHQDLVIDPGSTALLTAYHALGRVEWFFGLSTHMWAFRIYCVLAPLFLIMAFAIPKQFGRVWLGLGAVLGMIMTPVIVTLLFYIAVTPLALLLKVVGSDPLRRAKHEGSYWIPRDKPRPVDHFEHKS